jgi:hypothetical protein
VYRLADQDSVAQVCSLQADMLRVRPMVGQDVNPRVGPIALACDSTRETAPLSKTRLVARRVGLACSRHRAATSSIDQSPAGLALMRSRREELAISIRPKTPGPSTSEASLRQTLVCGIDCHVGRGDGSHQGGYLGSISPSFAAVTEQPL